MKKKSLLKRSDVIRMREMIKGIEGVRGLVSGARPSVILIWIFFLSSKHSKGTEREKNAGTDRPPPNTYWNGSVGGTRRADGKRREWRS